jgi:hypothetical protein
MIFALKQSMKRGIKDPLHAAIAFSKDQNGTSLYYENMAYAVPVNWSEILEQVASEFVSEGWEVCIKRTQEILASPTSGFSLGPQITWLIVCEKGYTCVMGGRKSRGFFFERK